MKPHGTRIRKYEVNFMLLITCSINERMKLLCSNLTQCLNVRMGVYYVRDHTASVRIVVPYGHTVPTTGTTNY